MVDHPSASGAARRAGKSAAAFRTISEVASELDLPQHVLRFWETRFSQIKPLKRGGGRRYYRPDDIVLLLRIKTLLYDDGYTIKGVQRLLRGSAVKVDSGAAATAATAGGQSPRKGALPPQARAEVEAVLGDLRAVRDLLKRAP